MEQTSNSAVRPAVIIGGGVGPMAGVSLHQAIIRNTSNVSSDSDHIDVWHISAVQGLPDRTGFLTGNERRNPAELMAENIMSVGAVLNDRGQRWLVAVPCATFHSPRIFDAFQRLIEGAEGYLGTSHIVGETIRHLRSLPAEPRRIGVLSTMGSYRAGVWRDPLAMAGLEVVELGLQDAQALHNAIYDRKYGLKAIHPPTRRAEAAILEAAGLLLKAGAQVIVLGCTELPFVTASLSNRYGGTVVLCDPVEVQARKLARLGSTCSDYSAGLVK